MVTFKGVIASIEPLQKVTLRNGEQVSLLNFHVSDETGMIRVSAWRENAEELAESLSVGQVILLKNVLLKIFRDTKQASIISDSSIETILD